MNTEVQENKTKKWLPVVIVLVLVVIFGAAWLFLKPSAQKGSKHITVTVVHQDKSENTYDYYTDQEYLRPVLCEDNGLISGSEEAYGLWIKTVDGETADDSKQEWWGYSVNGEDAMYGVEQQIVTDGDKVVFTLNVGY